MTPPARSASDGTHTNPKRERGRCGSPRSRFGVVWPLGIAGLLALACAVIDWQRGPRLPQIDRLTHASYSEEIPGSQVKFDMIAIPGGSYLMGSPLVEPGRSKDEGPRHPVSVRPFWMGKCEVTWD